MIIYARGINFKIDLTFYILFIFSFLIISILSIVDNDYTLCIFATFFLILNIYLLSRHFTMCYIKFNKEYLEYHTKIYKKIFGKGKPRVSETKIEKEKIIYIKYNNIIEWGNIKYLSKKISNSRQWNIGFITKDRNYYILTNEYSEKQLYEIINILKSKITIPPVKEITIDKKTINNYFPRAFNE